MVPVPESSTGIRERIEAGLPIGDAVPAPVVRYIEEHGLYAGSG
jgi:nicotinic acid mononucleotide adenylyltransferase